MLIEKCNCSKVTCSAYVILLAIVHRITLALQIKEKNVSVKSWKSLNFAQLNNIKFKVISHLFHLQPRFHRKANLRTLQLTTHSCYGAWDENYGHFEECCFAMLIHQRARFYSLHDSIDRSHNSINRTECTRVNTNELDAMLFQRNEILKTFPFTHVRRSEGMALNWSMDRENCFPTRLRLLSRVNLLAGNVKLTDWIFLPSLPLMFPRCP